MKSKPMREKRRRRITFGAALFGFVFTTLVASCVYSIVHIIITPPGAIAETQYDKLKSDYVLMLLQCILGLIVMFLPSVLERRMKIQVPNMMYIMFLIFLYGAIYLGEVQSFYYKIQNWDMILHTFSGLMLGALGFSVVNLLNRTEKVPVHLSPLLVAVFAFCFAVTLGVIWEVYEYTFDGVLHLNMQKFAVQNGAPLIGREALKDTMGDLIVDTLGALVMAVIGYVSLKFHKGWVEKMLVRRGDHPAEQENGADSEPEKPAD